MSPDSKILRSPVVWIGLMLFALTTIALATMYWIGEMRILPRGVHYGLWDLSGYEYEQFASEWPQWSKRWGQQTMTIEATSPYVGQSELTLAELGLSVSAKPILDDIEQLQTGTLWSRLKKRREMRNQTYSPLILVDQAVLRNSVNNAWPEIEASQPKNAERIITPDDRVQYQKEVPAYRIDWHALEKLVVRAAGGEKEHTWSLRKDAGSGVGVMMDSITAGAAAGAIGEVMVAGTGIGDTKATSGVNAATDHLSAAPANIGIVPLPVVMLLPSVTEESLRAENIQRKIAEFTTYFRSGAEGRVHNIQSAAAVVHDQLLAPGEVFDYGEVVREAEKRFGFKPAPVILNGKMVPGIGGGICQVSTTLYNAALLSGLKIVERQHHSLPVRYVPLGLDATFSDGNINFRFRNHEHSHLLIRTESSSSHLTVKLFGAMPANRSYRIETKIVDTLPPPLKYLQNRTLPPGKQNVIQNGKTGYIVETVRIHLENGKEIDRELVSRDVYQPQPKLIAIRDNVQPPKRNPKTPILEDGVSGPIF